MRPPSFTPQPVNFAGSEQDGQAGHRRFRAVLEGGRRGPANSRQHLLALREPQLQVGDLGVVANARPAARIGKRDSNQVGPSRRDMDVQPARTQLRFDCPRIRIDRSTRRQDSCQSVHQKPLLSNVRAHGSSGQLWSYERSHPGRASVHPEIGTRSKTPVPLPRLTRSPRVLLEWNWGFASGPDSWMDGGTSRVRSLVGPELAGTAVGAHIREQRFLMNGLTRVLATRGPIDADSWTVEAKLGPRRLHVHVTPRRSDLIGVTLADPRGGPRGWYPTRA